MNATGKRIRKSTGLNRYQVKHATHTHKSDAKRRRMGWGKSGSIPEAQR